MSIRTQINRELSILPADLQKRVLEFVTRLSGSFRTRRKDGEKLAKLAGILSPTDATELMEIIEEDCERIDDEW